MLHPDTHITQVPPLLRLIVTILRSWVARHGSQIAVNVISAMIVAHICGVIRP